jgi:hypothetical protein
MGNFKLVGCARNKKQFDARIIDALNRLKQVREKHHWARKVVLLPETRSNINLSTVAWLFNSYQ